MALVGKFLILFLSTAFATDKVYEGFKVFDIKPKTDKQLSDLHDFELQDGEKRSLDFLSFHNNLNDVVRLMVNTKEQNYVAEFLNSKSIEWSVAVENIQEKIEAEKEEQRLLESRKSTEMTFDRYYRFKEINDHLDSLESKTFDHAKVSVKTVGKSFEGRDIKIITVTNGDGRKKNSVFIDAGIHAREWIAPATSLYWLEQLLDSNSNYSQLLNDLDFVIQPVVNPDGYQYTFDWYRLWRKTRTNRGINCVGVDANRNYDAHWSETGSSSNSCAETFHGPSAFSENESQVSRDILHMLTGDCKFFLTLHSYGNYLLYPYAYANDVPENSNDLEEVAQAGAQAMRNATGVNYTVGSTAKTLYAASGSSIDYAHSKANIPIAIVMELGAGGFFGFDLPASQIERNVKESAVGIAAMSEVIARKVQNETIRCSVTSIW